MGIKASVIIPVYNAETTLVKCVESIVFGTFKDLEVVLVDDCSTDNSWHLCQMLDEKYAVVSCFQNEKNSGVSHTRNHGLQEAKGEYILFVDSDDWVSGHYAERLVCAAQSNEDALVICGLQFHENIVGYKKDYIWQVGGKQSYQIGRECFFDLLEKYQIQQIWNKVFLRGIIEKNHIQFDETQSMGEDFQFVLDYMETSHIERCFIINEPLYYYVRANNTSLMSKFGLIEGQNEHLRLKKLLRLSGEDIPRNVERYQSAIESSNMNSVYQAVHHKQWSRKEKLAFVECVVGKDKAKECYRSQNQIRIKEEISKQYRTACDFFPRIKAYFRRNRRDRLARKMKNRLINSDFSIISQNCIGGVFYHDMGLRFTSPTINLYFTCPDFVRFVLNLEYYLNQELRMTWEEEFPVGYLDNVAIFFQHYQTCSEAKEKWEERKKRINWSKIVVVSTDMEQFSDDTYRQWEQIPYPKVLLSAKKRSVDDVVFFPQYEHLGRVPNLIPMREFYKDEVLIKTINNLAVDKSGE